MSAKWPENLLNSDLPRLGETTQPTGQTIFIAPSHGRGRYHTENDCPHVSAGFFVIPPDDDRHNHYRDSMEKCMWCKYDANHTLELDLSLIHI